MWFMMSMALAGEPQVAFRDDGLLHGTVEVAASADAVRAVLDDAVRMARWSPDVIAYEAVGEPAGGCQVYAAKTKGMWKPLTYTSKRCRTTEGYRDNLVESDSFQVMTGEWTLTPVESGTRIDFVGDLELSLPVPKRLLSGARVKGLTLTLTKLGEAVSTP